MSRRRLSFEGSTLAGGQGCYSAMAYWWYLPSSPEPLLK